MPEDSLLKDLGRRMDGALDVLRKEFGGLRTGRASASLLEPIMVTAYGGTMPINQLANVSVPEPRMITVQVWDRAMVKAVDKAIRKSGLGLNPQTEGQVMRVPIPDLNEERRRELTRVTAKYAEQARVSVRNVRRDGIEAIAPPREGRRDLAGSAAQVAAGDPAPDRRRDPAHRRDLGAKGQGDHASLMANPISAAGAAPRALPQHVAIIMDGNGRWARARGLPRIAGHRRGAEAVRRAAARACELGIPYLTLFGFSSENWQRPSSEIHDLMGLLRHYLRAEIAELYRNGIRLKVIGQIGRLAPDIVSLIEQAEETTRDNSAITLTIALSYGGRSEIVAAVRAIAAQVRAGSLAARRGRRGMPGPPSVHRRPARSGFVDPHQRRAADQQFSVVAVRLFRARLYQDALARFRQGRPR